MEVSNAFRVLPDTMAVRNQAIAAQSLQVINRLLSEQMTTRIGDVVGRDVLDVSEPGVGETINILA